MFPRYLDTHSHLNHPMFRDDWHEVAERAIANGVWLIVVGGTWESSVRAVEIAEAFPYGVYAAVGFHPRHVMHPNVGERGMGSLATMLERFRDLFHHEKVVAIGEIGFHEAHYSDEREAQERAVFDYFLTQAADAHLPVLLEVARNHGAAQEHVRDLIARSPGADVRGIVHHFTGTTDEARAYHELGFYPSMTSLIARSYTPTSAVRRIPVQHLVESECPHVVSMQFSSRPDPNYLPDVVSHLALRQGVSENDFARQTTRDALSLFPKILRNLPA